jgi:hypothetical protein
MTAHGFRLSPKEAAKLNITQSIMFPGSDFSSILGVIHNLHCLVTHEMVLRERSY